MIHNGLLTLDADNPSRFWHPLEAELPSGEVVSLEDHLTKGVMAVLADVARERNSTIVELTANGPIRLIPGGTE